jgi:hypothetical protein
MVLMLKLCILSVWTELSMHGTDKVSEQLRGSQ